MPFSEELGLVTEANADESHDTESEKAYSEASTHVEPFFIPASKRARTLWTEACGGSKNLTVANVEAVSSRSSGATNARIHIPEPTSESVCIDPSMCSVSAESKPRYIQSSIQRYGAQSKYGTPKSQTLLQHIDLLLNSEKGYDILRLSCYLGYMEAEGLQAARDASGLDRVDDTVFHCIGRLREISKEMCSSLKTCIEHLNFREIIYSIAVTALKKYSCNCLVSPDGDSFLWRIANEKAEHINEMAVATFCVGLWPFVKEAMMNENILPTKCPEITMVKSKSKWLLIIKGSGPDMDQVFDVDVLHQCHSLHITGPTFDGDPRSLRCASDSLSPCCEGDLGRAFLLEFLELECKNLRGKQSKCIRSILEWNQRLDLRLCCSLPFVDRFKRMMEQGLIPSICLTEVQKFVSSHENHISDSHVTSPFVDESDESKLRFAFNSITRFLEEKSHGGLCSVGDVFSASLAVGSSVDLLLGRVERRGAGIPGRETQSMQTLHSD